MANIVTNHNGGCLEVKSDGAKATDGPSLNPHFTGAHRGLQVNADGSTRDLGPTVINGADMPKNGPTYYSENGARRLDASQVTDMSVVEIGGLRTTVGCAKRMGLLTDQGDGRLLDTSKEAKEALTQEPETKTSESISMATDDTDKTLQALDAAVGHSGTIEIANRAISHLTSPKHGTVEAAFENAGRAMAERSGVDPEICQQAMVDMFEGYKANAAAYLQKQGHDPEQIFAYASTLSQTARADLFRAVLYGKGPQALNALAKNFKNKNRY